MFRPVAMLLNEFRGSCWHLVVPVGGLAHVDQLSRMRERFAQELVVAALSGPGLLEYHPTVNRGLAHHMSPR